MKGKLKKLIPIIKIKNFPSHDKVMQDFKSFLSERKLKEKFKILNKSDHLLLYVNTPSIAYKYNERFNNKILANPLYSYSKCSLILKKPKFNKLNFSHNYSYIKPKLYEPIKPNTNKSLVKSYSVISDYERKHWFNLADKAGSINNDSPYMDELTKDFIERKNNEKLWIVKKKFNNFVSKRSSNEIHAYSDIKNYVMQTPSLPPLLYQFRQRQKNKWVGKADFQLY
jgi:hypothetical protein